MKKKFINEEIITLNGIHCNIMGHKPANLSWDKINNKLNDQKSDTGKFGLFDSSQPNYTTFYPDVTADDLNPTPDEFIEPVFRMLSKTVVAERFNPIDFGKGTVLKDSMDLLLGQSVNVDHETAVGNAIGAVSEVSWQGTTTTENGTKVPPGINATLKIDGKSNPRLARAILMDPPAIHSNSVTIRFTWIQSHPKMDADEFWSKLGTFDDKGVMIRKVVDNILGYNETSLVSHGADKFAKQIRNGKIVDSHIAASFSLNKLKELREQENEFFINYKSTESFKAGTIPVQLNTDNSKTQNQMKKIYITLAALIGLTFKEDEDGKMSFKEGDKEITEDEVIAKIAEKFGAPASESEELTNLKAEAVIKDTEIVTLKETQVTDELTAQAKVGTDTTDAVRKEAKRLYNSLNGDKAESNIVTLLETADHAVVKSLLKNYQDQQDEKFQATCKDCKGHNIEMSSSITVDGIQNPDGDKGGGDNTPKSKIKTSEELRKELHSKPRGSIIDHSKVTN